MRIDPTKRLSHDELESPVEKYTDPFAFTFTTDQNVEEVLHTLQSKKAEAHVEVFYITDRDNVLQGIITIQDLIYNPPHTKLIDIIEPDILKIETHEPLEKGLKLLSTHRLLIVPVVDKENRFVGILEILHRDWEEQYKSRKLQARHLKEDIFQFIGFSIEQRRKISIWRDFRHRMPWLLCNLVGGLICAVIGEAFEGVLVAYVILALFIPLVLTLSESIAIQSMTLSLRFLHVRKVNWLQVGRRIMIEWKTSLILGICSALVLTMFYFAWSTELKPILSISSSIVLAMIASASFGGLFPIVLHALKLDPKVAAGPVVLMMADIVTIAIYLSISTALLL